LAARGQRLRALLAQMDCASVIVSSVGSALFRAQHARLEGVFSKRAHRPYAPGDHGTWAKSKGLNRKEFVVDWTDPEGSREHIGRVTSSLLTLLPSDLNSSNR
jgi:ATP-dependent DNA ligase